MRVEWVEMGVSWWCRVVVGDQSEDGEGDGWSWAELGVEVAGWSGGGGKKWAVDGRSGWKWVERVKVAYPYGELLNYRNGLTWDLGIYSLSLPYIAYAEWGPAI